MPIVLSVVEGANVCWLGTDDLQYFVALKDFILGCALELNNTILCGMDVDIGLTFEKILYFAAAKLTEICFVESVYGVSNCCYIR